VLKLKSKLQAYAIDFTSFLLERINVDYIKRIILFGSVARGEDSLKSDVDLFIDVFKKISDKDIKKVKEGFLKSKKYRQYWLLKGIKNDFNIVAGKLNEWKDLKNSIISNGIILYGKFDETPTDGIHKTIFSWENIKPESDRVLLSKRIFGYKKGKKSYEGLVQKFEGEKIGKGIIAVPSTNTNMFSKLFRDMKISVKIRKIIEYK